MCQRDAQVFHVPTRKEVFDDSVITPATALRFVNRFFAVICGMSECGWAYFARSRAVGRSHRTVASGVVALEIYGKTSRPHEIICSPHPYGRFAQIVCRGLSLRPLVGAHAAPCQLLVYRLIGSVQLLPSYGVVQQRLRSHT